MQTTTETKTAARGDHLQTEPYIKDQRRQNKYQVRHAKKRDRVRAVLEIHKYDRSAPRDGHYVRIGRTIMMCCAVCWHLLVDASTLCSRQTRCHGLSLRTV